MSAIGGHAARAVVEIGRGGTKLLLTMRTALLLVKWSNPILGVQPCVVDKGICLRPCVKHAPVNGALVRDSRIGVDDLLIQKLIVGGHLHLLVLRMDRSHVVEVGRLLEESLITVFAGVSELRHVAFHVVEHRVLALEGLVAVLVLADKVASGILNILESHCKSVVSDISQPTRGHFNF